MSISISFKVYIILGLLWLPCFQKYILESLFKGLFGSTSYYSSSFQNIYLSYYYYQTLKFVYLGFKGFPHLHAPGKVRGSRGYWVVRMYKIDPQTDTYILVNAKVKYFYKWVRNESPSTHRAKVLLVVTVNVHAPPVLGLTSCPACYSAILMRLKPAYLGRFIQRAPGWLQAITSPISTQIYLSSCSCPWGLGLPEPKIQPSGPRQNICLTCFSLSKVPMETDETSLPYFVNNFHGEESQLTKLGLF